MKVNVEIIIKKHISLNSRSSIISVVQSYLEATNICPNTVISNFPKEGHPILYNDVQAIIVDDICNFKEQYIHFPSAEVKYYVYSLDHYGPVAETDDASSEDGEVQLSTHLSLPSVDLFTLWESLYYDDDVKRNLLQYAQTMMEFSDRGVDSNIVNCNRVILLHGPPGTGKTSLCKALAQKLSIRMQDRYSSGVFVEINSHSLFSKWFSESGKLVTKMFTKIKQMVEDSNMLVCVLIDEVESLAHARTQCISGNEPSDSVRVVNAVLTQIDQIKRYPNVLILTTSNMTEAIDLAFIDRADIKQYLGLPSVAAIYKIYHSCLEELIRVNIIKSDIQLLPVNAAFHNNRLQRIENQYCEKLIKVCERSVGLSGRSLRKIPFIAYALFLNSSPNDLHHFFVGMLGAIERERTERQHFDAVKKES